MEIDILYDQYKKIDSKLDAIVTTVSNLATVSTAQKVDLEHVKEDVDELKLEQKRLAKELEELKDAPNLAKAEKWKIVTNSILKSVATVAASTMLTYLGIKGLTK